jgi:RES domain
VRHRDLLIALSDFPPLRVEGYFERHVSLQWEELRASTAGGRWSAPGSFEALYLGRPRESVVVEAYRHLVDDEMDSAPDLAASILERRVVTCEVDVPNVLDLRSEQAHSRLGLTETTLCSEVGDYEFCQRIGAAAHQLRLAGVLAPAATRLGETLALFPTNTPIDYWPKVVKRELWHGLPADPRRLRLADEAT